MRGGPMTPTACVLVVLAVALPSATLGQSGGPTATTDLYGALRESLGSLGASVLFLAGGALLGAALKWAFDQISAKKAKQRDFVENTGKRVVELAWSHYWALANASGMLARPLTDHLRAIDAHLLLVWTSEADLRQRMREIADTTAEASFPAFVRLIHAFERFQFRGSNTYLLPHHASGEALRRLYNRFMESLGEDLNRSLTTLRLAVERRLGVKDKEGKTDPRLDLGSPQFEAEHWFSVPGESDQEQKAGEEKGRHGGVTAAADLLDAELARGVAQARACYAAWLRAQPASVAIAADSLHGYSRLLTHELALLHAVWHQDRGLRAVAGKLLFTGRRLARRSLAALGVRMAPQPDRWPHVLDPRAAEAIRQSRSVSAYYSPLGIGGRIPKPSKVDPPSGGPRRA